MVDVSDRVIWIKDGKVEKIENRADIKINVGGMVGESEHLAGSIDSTHVDAPLLV